MKATLLIKKTSHSGHLVFAGEISSVSNAAMDSLSTVLLVSFAGVIVLMTGYCSTDHQLLARGQEKLFYQSHFGQNLPGWHFRRPVGSRSMSSVELMAVQHGAIMQNF